MERALAIISAHTSILKPGGSFTLSIGISLAGVGAGGCGFGASGEFAMSGGRPCVHGGGGCCCASSGDVAPRPSSHTAHNTMTAACRIVQCFDVYWKLNIASPFWHVALWHLPDNAKSDVSQTISLPSCLRRPIIGKPRFVVKHNLRSERIAASMGLASR